MYLFLDSYQTPRQIFSSDHTRDPLLNPDVVKIRERQQAILKGLSELRQVSKKSLINVCLHAEVKMNIANYYIVISHSHF